MMWPFIKPTPQPGTRVDLCNNRVPVKYWSDPVKHDAWGRPYVTDGDRLTPFVVVLRPGGATDRSTIIWRHKDGPEVTFPDPKRNAW